MAQQPEAGARPAAPDPQRRTVRALTYTVIRTVAPGELTYFDALCRAYLRDPVEALRPTPRDSPDGSGFEAVFDPVTTIVLAAVTGTLSQELSQGFEALIRRLRAGKKGRAVKPPASKALDESVPDTANAGQAAAERFRTLATVIGLPAARVEEICVQIEITVAGSPTGASDQPRPAPDEA